MGINGWWDVIYEKAHVMREASVAQSDARLTGDQEVACRSYPGPATFFRGS